MDRLSRSVSVVIPAHNEEPAIASVVRGALSSTPEVMEVLVVDDGSTDRTAAAAAEAGARVLRLDKNQGKGLALQHGIREARGDILVFIDADGQDDPREIPALLAAFDYDVQLVLGSRFLGEFRPGAITRLNYAGTKFITLVLNLLFRTRVTDPLAGFRAVRRDILDRIELRAEGYDIEVDLLLRVLKAGGLVAEVGASRSPRPFGESGLSSLADGLRIVGRILQVRLERTTRHDERSTPDLSTARLPVTDPRVLDVMSDHHGVDPLTRPQPNP